MSWLPPNLAASCNVQTTITTCQPSTFMFMQLITQLFGYSLDSQPGYGGIPPGFIPSPPPPGFIPGSPPPGFVPGSPPPGFVPGPPPPGFIPGLPGFMPSGAGFEPGIPGPQLPNYQQLYNSGGGGQQQPIQEYDFIVVGAGSAGCVIANRLTEIPEWRVLLLEAGDEEPEAPDVPSFAPTMQGSSVDWGFVTQPDPNSCLARENGACNWSRGRAMGGSSVINYMIYMRGNPRDYDEWAAAGNYGWSYKEVLPYFMKSEDNHDIPNVAAGVHGVGGYLSVERFQYQDSNVLSFLNGFQEAGLPIIDQNSGRQIGASIVQTTSRSGKRMSANRAFIRPIRGKRPNLVIQTKAYAHRVLIDPQTKTAYGVEYNLNGQVIQARARKEVIVTCGSIMSPKVLMLSGIGPAAHLQNFNIPVLSDLRVGYNLMDHTTIDNVLFSINNESSTLVAPEQMAQDAYYYKEEQMGPLSSTGPLQLNAFVQTKYEYEPGRPDIAYSIDCGNVQDIVTAPVLAAATKVLPLAYYDTFIIRPVLLNPASRGVIKLNATDPLYGYPLIHANTFSEQIDLQRMVEGIKQSLNLLKTRSLQKIGISLVTTPMPACDNFKFGTDDYWACLIQSYTTTLYHFSGTNKMGPKTDPEAVVDPEFRVYGIKKMRVIDSSTFPVIPRGNTNAITIMMAEKGSDLIKASWLNKKFIPIPKLNFKNLFKSFFLKR